MNIPFSLSARDEKFFYNFCQKNNFNQHQSDQFLSYLSLLYTTNQNFNITAIQGGQASIERHFEDSLAIANFINCNEVVGVVDVGSGGGFPGIPLKIAFPHLTLILIEIVQKKISFLNEVIEELGLENSSVYSCDWRTFLRKTDYHVDLFLARASLDPQELIRIFKPSSPYQNSHLVYWASSLWQPNLKEKMYIRGEWPYTLQNKERRLILFAQEEKCKLLKK